MKIGNVAQGGTDPVPDEVDLKKVAKVVHC